ncbi:hypothetical protein BV25DRAFT_1830878 [Artomyces pyxidatus]|uniref:Uncharacterized protein n=1 Tax=Artomyces pyxidatus TaxID=48021 RepID=A0ACB8SMZ1_9AGAM|nr:hypothetical protein BV25DRAFT_1830878 [Artomyces pyxidatus]
MIFDYLSDDLYDVISLCLAHDHLLSIGIRTVNIIYRTSIATWTGKRVVCLGDYHKDDDLPEGMLTEEETAELAFDAESYTGSVYELADQGVVPDLRKLDSDFSMQIGRRDRQKLALLQPSYTTDDTWVLYNLSKHEYVRADALCDFSGYKWTDIFDRRIVVGFGTVLGARASWSSDGSVSMAYEGNLHRGVWAGDRFEITTLGRAVDREEWKDVSEEVIQELTEIWKSEYRNNWKKELAPPEPRSRHGW